MRVWILWFGSDRFDVEAEPENDINTIRGQSLLAWLRPRLEQEGWQVDGPDTEDWGWYLNCRGESGKYVVGAYALRDGEEVAWHLQVWRSRSIRERLRGAGHITAEDSLVRRIGALVREELRPADAFEELETR